MVRWLKRRAHIDRGATRRPRVCEVDVLPEGAVNRDKRNMARWTELHGVAQLLPAHDDVASPSLIVNVSKLCGPVPPRLQLDAELGIARDDGPRWLGLIVRVGK